MSLDSIEIIPILDENNNFIERLDDSLQKCLNVKGAVAFWTIDTKFLPSLTKALKNKNSYYCIDIHKPTNIDYIENFHNLGCNLYLHLYEYNAKHKEEKYYDPKYLLHSKVILLEFPDNLIEVWIGSHNFTRRAILGLNIELSVIVKSKMNSKIYDETLTFLEVVKNRCEKYNPDYKEYYETLQNEKRPDSYRVMDYLISEEADKLEKQVITILSKKANYFDIIPKVGDKILVIVQDKNAEHKIQYEAKILGASLVNYQKDTYDMILGKRKYAEIEPPVVSGNGLKIKEDIIRKEKLIECDAYIMFEIAKKVEVEFYSNYEKWQKQDQEQSEHLQQLAKLPEMYKSKATDFLNKKINKALSENQRETEKKEKDKYLILKSAKSLPQQKLI